jgi:hypothetical protein
MDELPELGGRDERDQPVTNEDDTANPDDEFDDWPEDADDWAHDDDPTYDDTAEHDTAEHDFVEYDADEAEHDDPEYTEYVVDDDADEADYDDPEYTEYAADDAEHEHDAGYDDEDDYGYADDEEPDLHGALVGPAAGSPAAGSPVAGSPVAGSAAVAGLVEPREPTEAHRFRRLLGERQVGAVPAFFLGALVGLLALGLVWATVAFTGSSTSEASIRQRSAHAAAPGAAARRSHPDPVAQCRAVEAAQQRALSAAGSTLDQWEVHVGAMNRLVVGAITLQQATQFWNQTRRGAQRRLLRFLSADQQVRQVKAHCPRSPDADASATLRTCSRAVAARHRALQAAATAVETWRRHVRDMEMLRTGRMSPAQANQMWLQNWHKGVVQLRAYRHAVGDVPSARC